MSFLNCYKGSPTCIADLTAGDQLGFDGRAILGRFDDTGLQCYGPVYRSRPQEFYMEVGGHCARCFALAALLHQVISRGPIRMAIQQGADNAAVENPGKGLMMRLCHELGNDLIALDKAADV